MLPLLNSDLLGLKSSHRRKNAKGESARAVLKKGMSSPLKRHHAANERPRWGVSRVTSGAGESAYDKFHFSKPGFLF
jgi:hypothetical protein